MGDSMIAAVFVKEGQLELMEVPVPKIERPDQVLLKVDAVSICGTDVHILEVPPGYIATPNTILGHELCGTVVEKGAEVHHLQQGDRVVVNSGALSEDKPAPSRPHLRAIGGGFGIIPK